MKFFKGKVKAAFIFALCAFSAVPAFAAGDAAVASVNSFAFRAAPQFASGGSFLISPYSILSALGMTWAGSAGATREAMAGALSLNSGFHASMGRVMSDLHLTLDGRDDNPLLRSANRIWLNDGLTLRQAFAETLRADYAGGAETLNFTKDPDGAVKRINDWTDEHTNGKIKDLLGAVEPKTEMILTNAVYFLGRWQHEFPADKTADGKFSADEKTQIDMPMMHMNKILPYGECDGVKLLSLPYTNRVSMLIALPGGFTSDEVLKSLNEETFAKWKASLAPHTTDVTLPKFRLENKFSLKDALTALGMGNAFERDANFTGIIEEDIPLMIGDVIHRTFIDVNESSTEAAGATAVIMMRVTSLQPDLPNAEFRADRPFLFFIIDDSTGMILFSGRCSGK